MRVRGRVVVLATAGMLIAAAPAGAEITSVFNGAVPCQAQPDGTRFCGGPNTQVPTFDGVPIDVNVALPPAPAKGPDGPYPMVMVFHGYGGSELGLDTLERWTRKGYAAFSMSDRGFGRSCGGKDQLADPACAKGYVRLMDTRYEVRDAQTFAGMLVDEGVADRRAIGATGGSYGGGMSMALAALRDRMMMPDGSLVQWRSPAGKPMRIAAAAPDIPWTDLAYALMPSGGTLDYVADSRYGNTVGVMKQTFVFGLFASGSAAGNYAPPGTDPDADLDAWFTRINAGEPYDDAMIADILDEIETHHSSYYIDDSIPPAPLLISNGWTDDLFPADEAIRFYNRTRTLYPKADISLFFSDHGHMRGQNKPADNALLKKVQNRWFKYFLKHQGKKPFEGVETLTQTCPSSASSAGPFRAPSWATAARGEIRLRSASPQTMAPMVSDPAGQSFDPVLGKGACAQTPATVPTGALGYDLKPAPKGGFLMLGSPTVIADIDAAGPNGQIAARLLDVSPDGQQTLVARGLWRPASGSARQVFQLHPNGYEFGAGHIARLELLPADPPYSRPSNSEPSITFSNLQFRLPVRERPGSLGKLVKAPAPKLVPPGMKLARDFRAR
ncbi:MAG: CocE/NonD family hydrolase [Solirubrobacterales bacterium]